MILAPLFLAQWFAVLAVEATLVTVAAVLIAQRVKSANRQRAIWQGAALGLLMLAACEATGVTRAIAGLVKVPTQSRQTVKVIVRTFPPAIRTSEISAPEEQTVSPQPRNASVDTPGRSVWWPAVLWLTGFVVIVARTAFARVLFLLIGKRRQPESLEALLPRMQRIARQLGLGRRLRVTESERLSGPIAFGILRPSICLPKGFAQQFSVPQQDAILAHELAHVAARDPAWYCLADIVTALWWWHPLAWWSRRQLHASSESAADEASLLVNDGPGALAECLVEMGRRLTRTQSFGWLSIEGKEFRSGLGRRVTRLLSLSGGQWRKTRPSLWLAVCVGFFMVLVAVSAGAAWNSRRNPEHSSIGESWRDSIAIRAWKSLVGPDQSILLAQAEPKPARPLPQPDTSRFEDQTTLTPEQGRKAIREKLDRIILEEVAFDGIPFSQVVSNLSARARERDPEGKGVNMVINDVNDWPKNHPLRTMDQQIRVQPALKNVSLRTVLNAVVADGLIKWSVTPNAILFSPNDRAINGLYTRSIKIDPNTVMKSMDGIGKWDFKANSAPATRSSPTSRQRPEESLVERLGLFFRISGVDLNPPKALFLNERNGILTVRATLQDLDVIEQAIQVLSTGPPQLTIDVKFVEVSENEEGGLNFLTLILAANGAKNDIVSSAEFTGVLTDPQYRTVLRALEQGKGVDILSAPSVTTLSGRQTQIKVDVQYINTDLPMDFGPMVDVVPKVLSDGYTISMTIIPTVKEFLGYHVNAGKILATGAPGEEAFMLLPSLRVRQVESSATLWDGQTVVVGVGSVETPEKQKPGKRGSPKGVRKSLFVLVTPTIIDPAGNRVHTPEDFPLRTNSVPPQRPAP